MMILRCKYCNKETKNPGALSLHEKSCKDNPNRVPHNNGIRKGITPWNKGLTKYTSDSVRKGVNTRNQHYLDGTIKRKHGEWHMPEEAKRKISEKQKQWLKEHKDIHPWRTNKKFISKPCETLKKYLTDKKISFVEEYQPYDDLNFSLDIAWPDEKIAIEVNGNQHYQSDGSLLEYYQKRHDILTERGWKIFEIHYTKCYYPKFETFEEILSFITYI